jgi:chemotaxis protein CheD
MVRLFEKTGSRKRDIEVKCFGGADLFARRIERKGFVSVGRQNIAQAEQVLTREGFTIAKRDVGGLAGRKLFFYTHTGEVLLKRLSGAAVPASSDPGKPREDGLFRGDTVKERQP